MHILVATDGTLDVDRAADAVARWYDEGDTVTVMTVMNIPTDFLGGLVDSGVKEAATIALEAGQGIGDRAAEQMSPARRVQADPAMESPVMKALAATAHGRTQPITDALKARGIKTSGKWTTSDNKTAKAILAEARRKDSGLVVLGSHGKGRFEGLLGSTGTKIVRLAPASVLLIRNADGDSQ